MLNKRELTLQISDLSRGGAGVARTAEGQVVFVPFTMPGDECRIEVVSEEKRYLQGKMLELLKPAPDRIEPQCPVFGKCGGCDWQHIPYESQWKRKVSGLREVLKRNEVPFEGNIEELPAADPWQYRNRIQLRGRRAAEGGVELGMFGRGSHDLVPVESCAIARPELNAKLPELLGQAPTTGEFKLELEVLEDGSVRHAWNRPHAAFGFRQVNETQNSRLKRWVSEAVLEKHPESGGVLFDLYGGAGNLSLAIASHFERVVCVDVGARAAGKATPSNWSAIPKPVETWISGAAKAEWPTQRSAILDPPREGLGRFAGKIIEAMIKLRINNFVLVGCDEDAWGRDLRGFLRRGARVTRVAAVDLFPQTHHVECLAQLSF